jgi:acyl phosphate:glycerol-3-phosphate acyltransferase
MSYWLPIAAVAVAYLLGSIPFGVVVARFRHVDLRQVGSGNIGATNAARALGRKLGALVLLLDAAKAYVPLQLCRYLFAGDARESWILAAVAFAAFFGHLFPIFLAGKGGKGVATGFGIFLALAPLCAGIAAAVWVGLYAVTRISSVGSLVATSLVIPALALRHEPTAYVVLAAAMTVLIFLKHRGNIQRLLRKQEGKV